MSKSILFILIIVPWISVKSQNVINCPVLLVPVVENAVIEINGVEKELDSLFVCVDNCEVEIKKGKVNLLDIYGREINLKEGNTFILNLSLRQQETKSQIYTLHRLSNFLNNPSFYLPNLYNNDRNLFVIFPLRSNVIKKANIKFYLLQEFVPGMEFNIYVKNSDSLIFSTDEPLKEFDLYNVPLKEGKTYEWRLYNGSNSIKGEFKLLNKEQSQKIIVNSLKTEIDYLIQFISYMENKCKFDAVAVLIEGIRKYPDNSILKSLLDKFPDEHEIL